MNMFNRDMMWITAACFALMGVVAWAFMGFSVFYAGLFVFALAFFVIGLLAHDEGVI